MPRDVEKSLLDACRASNFNARCHISLAAVGGNSTGTGGDQGKKKGNSGGEHGGGIGDFPGAGNGLDGLDGLDGHDANVECCSLEEVRAWGTSFDRLMKSAAGRNLFNEFLKSEYSEENIAFWMACEQLKRESNPKLIVEKAKYIYNNHISIISPKEVSTLVHVTNLSLSLSLASFRYFAPIFRKMPTSGRRMCVSVMRSDIILNFFPLIFFDGYNPLDRLFRKVSRVCVLLRLL